MEKTQMIHNGVSKKVYATDEPDKVIIQYTDAITAYYKIKKALIKDKGLYCNAISSMIFKLLADSGVPVHFIERISDTEQICRRVDSIAMEVIVRNVIAGSMAHRLGMDEGVVPDEPVIDLCYKSEDLGEPLINDSHAIALGLVNKAELAEIENDLAHMTDVTIHWFEFIRDKYGKDHPRLTEIRSFETIEATKVVEANEKLYIDRQEGFVGTGL